MRDASGKSGEPFFSRVFALTPALPILVSATLLLTIFGLVAISSASLVRAPAGRPYHFLIQQSVWFGISFVVTYIVAFHIDYRWFARQWAVYLIAAAVLVGLALVLVPGIGIEIKGSRRWIDLGPMNLQPSEFAKIGFVFVLAKWFDYMGPLVRRFKFGVLAPGVWTGIVVALLFMEPDYGSCALVAVLAGAIMFAGGANLLFLLPIGLVGAIGFGFMVAHDPVRMGRVLSFLHPEQYPEKAHQLLQAIAAFKNGGPWGVGIGNSTQKLLYLPEAHTDSIIAIAGEEFGVVATIGVIVGFLFILYCGMRVAMAARDSFGRLLAFGLTLMLVIQAGVNFGVNTGCLPTKGMALPFISYGGTSLLASWLAVALIVNVGRVTLATPEEEPSRNVFKNTVHRV